MGGEYLPELESDEVEIARLDLASTTADVIALVAGRAGSKIRYRVVDEYETNYVCAPESSDLPLTLRELVALLDHAHAADAFAAQVAYGLIEGFWEQHLLWGDTPEHAVSFAAVSSAFYPALAECYEGRAEEWIGNSRENPLPPEALASLETAWQQATTEQRRVVVEFLKSHGYERGSFRMYGARHLQLMLTLLAHQPLASRTVQVPADGGTPR